MSKPRLPTQDRILFHKHGFRYCPKCNIIKRLSDFYTNASRAGGLNSWCTECARNLYRIPIEKSPQKQAILAAQNLLKQDKKMCKKCGKVKQTCDFYANRAAQDGLNYSCIICTKNDYQKYILMRKKGDLRRKYGMTYEDFIGMKIKQNGGCAICGDVESGNNLLVVDHVHSTGIVRGLLCSRCNQGLGLLRENSNILLAAMRYIDKSRSDT